MGRSGCGKGTQAKLLIQALKEKSSKEPFYLSTGDEFRKLISSDTYSSGLAKKIIDEGKLQPEFLAIVMWGNLFMNNLTGNEDVIVDGAPRTVDEAHIIMSAVNFYGFKKVYLIDMEVSRQWATDRLTSRARADDNPDAINNRMNWYEELVAPCIPYFNSISEVNVITLNGEQSIVDVQNELLSKIS